MSKANWRRLWLAQAVSLTGDSVFDVTVMLWVAAVLARDRPWAPAATSGVLIAAAAPVLVVGPLAGVWVDRWDKRRTMMTADVSRAAVIVSLLPVAGSGPGLPLTARLAVVYTVVAAESSLAQFFNPSRFALIGLIVAPADRPRASGQLRATASTASIIGPPVAAPMLFALGLRWAIVIGTGALNALEIFFLRDNLHIAASWLGSFSAVIGIGAIAGALLGGWAGGQIGAPKVFWSCMVAGGLLLLFYSRLADPGPALVVLAMIGSMFGAINAAAQPILLALVPPDMTGRVMSVFNPLQQVANLGSLAIAGFLAGTILRRFHAHVYGFTFGPIDTIFSVSALLVMIAGLAMIRPLSALPQAGANLPARGRVRRAAAGQHR